MIASNVLAKLDDVIKVFENSLNKLSDEDASVYVSSICYVREKFQRPIEKTTYVRGVFIFDIQP